MCVRDQRSVGGWWAFAGGECADKPAPAGTRIKWARLARWAAFRRVRGVCARARAFDRGYDSRARSIGQRASLSAELVAASPAVDDYLTDGLGLFRVAAKLDLGPGLLVELEDCRTLAPRLASLSKLAAEGLELVDRSAGGRSDLDARPHDAAAAASPIAG